MDLKISPLSVQEETVRKLREAIMIGYFAPGERLVESSLCERLGVSRNSLREAMRVLAAERMVVLTPNRGPSVVTIEWADAEQLYETRILLESELAALAARHATPENLAAMQRALDAFAQAVESEDRLARIVSTTDFYEALIVASRHRVMGDLIKGLVARINVLRAKSMDNPGRSSHSLTEMTAMHDAIARHDEPAARLAATRHIEASRESARVMFERARAQQG
ncbi:GntR family transcriptional regulator [Bordetella sp. N]|uniref:GntR family transcriptional regulator n=1 Tax=Bordetella sp. N TaxID=1746199 RepID=UPI000708DBE2|nr:GntR family transcriptional regulator [Bordetella sp. N]ALM81852.1 hypothetical protein ASB57_01730 [Bordetella sp. N]